MKLSRFLSQQVYLKLKNIIVYVIANNLLLGKAFASRIKTSTDK